MKSKQTAQQLLCIAAQASVTAWQDTLEGIRLLIQEPLMKKALAGAKADSAKKLTIGAVRQRLITAQAKAYVKDVPNAWGTISGYIRKAASIVLVPGLTTTITTGEGKEASTRTVSANDIKTRRDMSALAQAANAKLGIKQVEGAGRTTKTPAQTPEEKAKVAAALAIEKALANAKENQKLAEAADKGASQTIVAMIKKAFDGQHPHMKQAVIDGLAAVGFGLVTKDAAAKIVAAAKADASADAKPKGKGKATAPEQTTTA